MELVPIDQALNFRADFDIFLYSKKPDPKLLETGSYPPLPVLRVTEEPVAGTRARTAGNDAKAGPEAKRQPAGPDGRPVLVWGWELLRAAEDSGIEEIWTQSFSCSAGEAIELALRLEDRKDAYSWRECEAISDLMRQCGITGGDGGNAGALLSLLSSQGYLRKKIGRFSSLSPSLKDLVEDGSLSLKNATKVSSLPDEIFRELRVRGDKLTVSGKRIFLQYIQEIGKRDGLSESVIVSRAKDLLSSEDPLRVLRRLRFPRLSAMEDSAEEFQNNYVKGSGIRIEIPQNFEGDELTVSFLCKSREEFAKKRSKLEKIELHIDELFTILR